MAPIARWLPKSACIASLAACLHAAMGDSRAKAQDSNGVDVELVLAVDVSLSMSFEELDIQRKGYAAALTDPAVVSAIRKGAYGRIAIAYMEWAGDTKHRLVVPWRVIASAADAQAVARELEQTVPQGQRRTSISGAIREGMRLLDQSPYESVKKVIDISGDGPNNQGEMVTAARDAAIAKGVVINGLPLMTSSGPGTMFNIGDLDAYYADCVIGGPGAFSIPVTDWEQFPEAVRRKLVLELAGPPAVDGAKAVPTAGEGTNKQADCLVGEKIWEQRRWMFDDLR